MNLRGVMVLCLWLVVWCVGLGVPAVVSADLLRLKDGGTLKGRVLKRTATEIVVQLEFGTMTFTPEEVVAVDPEPISRGETVEVQVEPRAAPSSVGDILPEVASTAASPEAMLPSIPSAPDLTGQDVTGRALPEAMQAVVFIASLFPDGSEGIGSGTLINRHGVMVTNYHVVEEAKEVRVLLLDAGSKTGKPRRPYEARKK